MKKLFIVTGANGFLGNNIVRELAQNSEIEIRALVLQDETPHIQEGKNCTIFHGDVTMPDTLEPLFENLENKQLTVIHCAAKVSIKSGRDHALLRVNVDGTLNVAQRTLQAGGKLLYISSVHAIPERPKGQVITEVERFEPDNVVGQYAKSKAMAANLVLDMVKNQGLNACILHPSGIIGPGDYGRTHTTQLIIDYARGKLRACVNGGYDFVDVRDVARGIIAADEKGSAGECYILSNRYIEIRELLDTVGRVANIKKLRTILPAWFVRTVAPLAELYYDLLGQPPLFTKYSLYTLSSNGNFSNAKATRELGYKTRSLEDTLHDTVKWLRGRRLIPV